MGPVTDRMVNRMLNTVTGDSFQSQLTDRFVSPLTKIINQKVRPYLLIALFAYLLLLALVLYLIYLMCQLKSS